MLVEEINLRGTMSNTLKWDTRFLELAKLVASWSKDPSTQTGAVIINKDRTIVSIGYNGFPRGMYDNQTLYNNRETKYSRIIHAEMNALLNSKQQLNDCILYTWPLGPCDRCVVHFLQAGVTRFVFPKLSDELKDRWYEATEKSKKYITEMHLQYTEI